MEPAVSIIVPIHNGEAWIDRCFESIRSQNVEGFNFEVCVCNDASSDKTDELLEKWKEILGRSHIQLSVYDTKGDVARGVGYAKNRAVSISRGEYLCFQDVDDVMLPDRIQTQYTRALQEPPNTLVGCGFRREPSNSTTRYTKWANSLTQEQLATQIYTSHGPTIIMPTWFCHHSVYLNVGGFSETGRGTPEDLIFFYRHLDLGGRVCRVDQPLLIYTYHLGAATFSVREETIWKIRIERVEKEMLPKWPKFTIWNAGKQGRKFYHSLSEENRAKVTALCDVNTVRVGTNYTPYSSENRSAGPHIPIIHFSEAQAPFVMCVKLDMTNGDFEKNVESLNLKENDDYVYFS